MSWVINHVDPNDTKTKIDWFYLVKIVLNIVQGDQFFYIILEISYKYSSYYYSNSLFLLRSLIPFSQGLPSILYYLFPFISAIHV